MDRLESLIRSFSLTEKIIFRVFAGGVVITAIISLWQLNGSFLTEIPKRGGEFYEGIVGTPRFVNPVLSLSDADRDVTALIYSGLMKTILSGGLIPDLAEKYEVSDDGRIYTFTLKENIYFHDGEPITSEDVVFTVGKALDPAVKSPKRANWEGVSVSNPDGKTVVFSLAQPYSPFLENTTMGILPKHIWEKVPAEAFAFSQFNIEPVGSGPYMLGTLKKNSSGLPRYYRLEAYGNHALGRPWISSIYTYFYDNEFELLEAYKSGEVDSMSGISPEAAEKIKADGGRVETLDLSRVFAVFFNHNESAIFANLEVRRALDAALDKEKIIDFVLKGYGATLGGPIPPGSLPGSAAEKKSAGEVLDEEERLLEAGAILERNGWKKSSDGVYEKKIKTETQKLEFSISTSDSTDLKRAAELIKNDWEKLGAKVDVKIFSLGDLNQNVIRPRKYDSILFGEVVGRDIDLFAFWHSSQRNDPGLNIALYTNITADRLLEEARKTTDRERRAELYRKFESEVIKDAPAVFVYAPDFIYVMSEKLKGPAAGAITTPSERFASVYDWFINTEKVWEFFAD